jgi:hypothetical protein
VSSMRPRKARLVDQPHPNFRRRCRHVGLIRLSGYFFCATRRESIAFEDYLT